MDVDAIEGAPVDGVVDLQPGLHTTPDKDGGVHLIAHRCTSCSTRFFPQRLRCVSCFSDSIAATQLGRRGVIDAFTIVRQAPPGYFGPVPYVLAMVKVDEDIVTLCHLTGKEHDQWQRGETVESCEFILPVGGDRVPKRTYAFRPVESTNNEGS